MTEFECRTWFLGILEVVKVAGMIMESRMGVMGHNMSTCSQPPKGPPASLPCGSYET